MDGRTDRPTDSRMEVPQRATSWFSLGPWSFLKECVTDGRKDGLTDGLTDGWTDGRTDGPTWQGVESRARD